MARKQLTSSFWMAKKFINDCLKPWLAVSISFVPTIVLFVLLQPSLFAQNSQFLAQEYKELTKQFDASVLSWTSNTVLTALNHPHSSQNQINTRFTRQAWQQLNHPCDDPIELCKRVSLKAQAKTIRRGVLIRQFFWDVKLSLIVQEKSSEHQHTKILLVRVVNGVGRVNPSSFVIHSISTYTE